MNNHFLEPHEIDIPTIGELEPGTFFRLHSAPGSGLFVRGIRQYCGEFADEYVTTVCYSITSTQLNTTSIELPSDTKVRPTSILRKSPKDENFVAIEGIVFSLDNIAAILPLHAPVTDELRGFRVILSSGTEIVLSIEGGKHLIRALDPVFIGNSSKKGEG